MASNINPYSIDGTFPIANQDNSSQGFRDNFTNIKNNFTFAESEISDLQTKAIVTSALNNQTLNNDMGGTQIFRPQLASWTQSLLDLGAINGDSILNFNLANFQKVTTAGPINLQFLNWPASIGAGALGYGLMRVWIVVSDVSHTITLPASVSIGVNDIASIVANGDGTHTIMPDTIGDYIFDFSSIDGGNNYLIFDNTRNRIQFRDPTFYFNPEVNPTLLIGYNEASIGVATTLETGTDTVGLYGSINSVQIDDLSLNSINTLFDTSPRTPGYTITVARGNVETGDVQTINSGDFLGYVQAYAQTGSEIGYGGFQQMAAIGYYATGVDGSGNGIGGNIGFFTRQDDDPTNTVHQAVGIENDQSVQLFGNLITSNVFVPTTSSDGGTTGQISFDSDNIYICLGPNNWKKASLTSF